MMMIMMMMIMMMMITMMIMMMLMMTAMFMKIQVLLNVTICLVFEDKRTNTPCPKKIVPIFYFFSRCPVCGEWCKLH